MKIKGSRHTSGTGLLEDGLSVCQQVRAHLLDLLTGGTRDQFWCETLAGMERSTYTHYDGWLERWVIANTFSVDAESYLCQYGLNGNILSRRPDAEWGRLTRCSPQG